MTTNDVIKRFWSKTRPRRNGCIDWIAAKNAKGYGRLNLNNKNRLAHRVAWLLSHKTIPDNMLILHKCDNPCCVNVAHLFIGNNQDNMDDKMKKGRDAATKGYKHSNDTLIKMSVCQKGIPKSDISKLKMSIAAYNRHLKRRS